MRVVFPTSFHLMAGTNVFTKHDMAFAGCNQTSGRTPPNAACSAATASAAALAAGQTADPPVQICLLPNAPLT